jgi:carbamoyltransferase
VADRQPVFLGISATEVDPAVAAVVNGEVVAYAEEERFLRTKHAAGRYPSRALRYCLEIAGVRLDDVASVTIGYDLPAYTDGGMRDFFAGMAREWPLDAATLEWQRGCLRELSFAGQEALHHHHWRREYGDLVFPPIRSAPHHFTHAFQAAMEAPFAEAVVLTVDGSGDRHTTVVWLKRGAELTPLREVCMPHSLGWFYAAFTEYLGFEAYDGEYKVMGLAAHGAPDPGLADLVGQVLAPAPDGVEFRLDPSYIHYGEHSYSHRFTDKLVKLLGAAPRLPRDPVTAWHMDLAFAVQQALEDAACRLIRWAVTETGVSQVCVGGGVGLNVKMNSRIFALPEVSDVFAHPLCADSGQAAGAALVTCHRETGALPPPLSGLALGPEQDDDEIEAVLRNAGVRYERSADICETISHELAAGRLVAWCQGRLEAGPRALGQRSILADPRGAEVRDRVNAAVKQRELWRPFGPSMLAGAAERYFERWTDSRYMTMAFPAGERLRRDAPAIVHTDGSCRVQLVHEAANPRYHRLIERFGELTGVPVLLNTSFNVRGEPIVSTAEDALRTFFATGLDVLAVGGFVVRKDRIDDAGGRS